ncbi:hypothetical protein HHI36_006061 [Cryptolaemus montrouzieri]|uniref:CHK kinase-like domain-containing protein n=1 Tax=Cryptolaemus montrouzieri TaxID=559131 RepID=A0ABD2NW48_9CUCU
MNFNICNDLVSKSLRCSEIIVRKFDEQKLKPPFGSLCIHYERDELVEKYHFVTKKHESHQTNDVHLFKGSYSKETLTHTIFEDIHNILGVSLSFTPEVYFSNEHMTVFNLDSAYIQDSYSTEHIDVGISVLAKFHAVSLAYIRSKSIHKRFDLENIKIFQDDPLSTKNLNIIIDSIWEMLNNVRETYPNTFLDDINVQDVQKALNKLRKDLEHLDKCDKVLINGNYIFNHLLFCPDCKVGDFFHTSYQSPLFDLFQYVSSYSSEKNWQNNSEKSKYLYYEMLQAELTKYNIIGLVFQEYTRTFELLKPFMRLLFYLGNIKQPLCETSNILNLLEILNILNLSKTGLVEHVISFNDCYKIMTNLKMETPKLESFKTKTQHVRNGFLGQHYDLEIELNCNSQLTRHPLFLKAIPKSEALQEFANTVGSFFKETRFYDRYIKLLEDYNIDILIDVVPKCYFADEFKYIVLENLVARGFSTLSPRDNIQNETMTEVIKILVKLHASCLILEELIGRKTGEEYRLFNDFIREFKEPFYSSVPVIDSHKNSGRGGLEALVELVIEDEREMIALKKLVVEACKDQNDFAKPSTKWRNTLCHSDLWTKNFMVQVEDNQVKNVMIIDFQTYRYAPPAQDLMAFIYLNSCKLMRDKHLNSWLELYYELLTENLRDYGIDIKSILSKRDYKESCEFYEQFSVTQSITHFQVILAPSDILEPLLLEEESCEKIFFGTRYDLVMKVWEHDELYRKRLTEAILELKKCLISKQKAELF